MLNGIRQRVKEFADDWAGPIFLGLATAVVVWVVWYFTKAPCTATAAGNGLCNPSALAGFINHDILIKAGGAGLAIGALKGGYNRYMMNREREARQHAERQLAEERERIDGLIEQFVAAQEEARRRNDGVTTMLAELISEVRVAAQEEARRRNDGVTTMLAELISEVREERRQSAANQQALIDTILRLTQQGNGRSDNGG